ncbi:oligosaccharide flippase family protein [Vibrio cyclitrophicus]|nr:oligosaccharide flippase family protein [Vibrio cyclitrophicus]
MDMLLTQKKIKNFFSHSVAINSFQLMMIQVVNLVVPLIALPYLTRVLNVDNFGFVMMTFSINAFTLLIVDYGFNLSATHKIAKNKSNVDYVNRYASSVFFIKTNIFFIVLVISSIVNFSFDLLTLYQWGIVSLGVFSQIYVPSWFYQGIEKVKTIAIFTLITRFAYLFMVFITINTPDDAILVVLLQAISNIGLTVLLILDFYNRGYKIVRVDIKFIFEVFKYSTQFFISRFATSAYTTLNNIVLGSLSNLQQVAMFSASEKIYSASQAISGPLSRALFPYLSSKSERKILYIAMLIAGLPMVTILSLGFYYSEELLILLFGADFADANEVLQFFLLTSLVTFFSVNLGYPAFATLNRVDIPNLSVMFGAFIQISQVFFLYLIKDVNALSIAQSILITEVVVLSIRLFFYIKLVCKSEN